MRICILGSPRSGSSYLTDLFNRMNRSTGDLCLNLGDPFSENTDYLPIFYKNTRYLTSEIKDISNFSLEDRVSYILKILSECDKRQPLVLKLFFYPYLDEYLDKIIPALIENGFKFVVLKRNNLEEQLISGAVTEVSKIYTTFHGTLVGPYQITNFEAIKDHYDNIKRLDTKLEEYNLSNTPIVYYETLHEDLSKFLGKEILPVTDSIKIQRDVNDLYRYILNKDEFKEFLKTSIGIGE